MRGFSLAKLLGTGDLQAYLNSAKYIVRSAERDFSIPLNDEAKQKVSNLFRCIYWLDDYVDSLKGRAKMGLAKEIFDYFEGKRAFQTGHEKLDESLHWLKDQLDLLPTQRKVDFIEAGISVFKHTYILETTKSPREFIDARRKEAEATANLFLCLVAELGDDRRFPNYLRRVAALGNFVDSIVDYSGDKSRGEIAVNKPVSVYFRLTSAAVVGLTTIVVQHPRKRGFAEMVSQRLVYMRTLSKSPEHNHPNRTALQPAHEEMNTRSMPNPGA